LRLFRETQATYGEKLKALEGEVASLVKNMEEWRKQADRAFGDEVRGLKEKLGAVEGELRLLKERYGRVTPSAFPAGAKEKEVEKGASPSPSVAREAGSGTEEASSAISPGADRIYNAAYADFLRGAYDLALSGFRDYLAKYPKGSLAANSQYWLGECYYSQKKFREAIGEFELVIKNYPKSAKAPGALLKKGYSYLALGDTVRAKSTLVEVLEKYPKTREAGLAEDQLGKMR
ncbi:MAG: tol-pal system protein YbgF, partial [candidate division NC10 bacterium]|nr:tol-pal system protein YbgF [candidate division NC10 bacterium]